jgi:hypothetical protein
VLEQQKGIRRPLLLPLRDEAGLHVEAFAIGDPAEAPDLQETRRGRLE